MAPDWTADWLHREATAILDRWAQAEQGRPYGTLDLPLQAAYRERLRLMIRTNTFDRARRAIGVDSVRADAIRATSAHFMDVFAHGRKDYAIPAGATCSSSSARLCSWSGARRAMRAIRTCWTGMGAWSTILAPAAVRVTLHFR